MSSVVTTMLGSVTVPTQRDQVVWVKCDAWIPDVHVCQMYDVVNFCRRLTTMSAQELVTHKYGLAYLLPLFGFVELPNLVTPVFVICHAITVMPDKP